MKERLMENMTVKNVIKVLKKTKTVLLPIGGTEQHGWHLPLSTDAIYGYSLAKKAIEAGTFEVMIGSSSEDIRLTGRFEVK